MVGTWNNDIAECAIATCDITKCANQIVNIAEKYAIAECEHCRNKASTEMATWLNYVWQR